MSEAPAEATTTEPQQPAPSEQPARATETDWKSEARKWEARAKENAEKAKAHDAYVESQQTEQQKLETRATTAEQRATEIEARLLRYEVAAEKGIPLTAAARLQGATKEELEADADNLLSLIGERDKPRTPKPDPTQGRGNNPSLSTAQQFAAALDGLL